MAKRTVTCSICLPLSADVVWQLVERPQTFAHLSSPLMGTKDPLPEKSFPGLVMQSRLYLFKLIPLWVHRLEMKTLDTQKRVLVTNERSRLIHFWQHRIEVIPDGANACFYQDTLTLDAGFWTPIFVQSVRFTLRYRHLRWRSLIRLTRAHLIIPS